MCKKLILLFSLLSPIVVSQVEASSVIVDNELSSLKQKLISLKEELLSLKEKMNRPQYSQAYKDFLNLSNYNSSVKRLNELTPILEKSKKLLGELEIKEEKSEEDKVFINNYLEHISYMEDEIIEIKNNQISDLFSFEEVSARYLSYKENILIDILRLFELENSIIPNVEKELKIKKETEEKVITFLPANGVFTSYFGPRNHPIYKEVRLHSGIDIAGSGPIVSVLSGTVEFVGWDSGYGNLVIINHGKINGKTLKTKYAHLSSIAVKKGQRIKKGQGLGIMGSTGNSTGTHLHFEILENNKPVNPLIYLKGVGNAPKVVVKNKISYAPKKVKTIPKNEKQNKVMKSEVKKENKVETKTETTTFKVNQETTVKEENKDVQP